MVGLVAYAKGLVTGADGISHRLGLAAFYVFQFSAVAVHMHFPTFNYGREIVPVVFPVIRKPEIILHPTAVVDVKGQLASIGPHRHLIVALRQYGIVVVRRAFLGVYPCLQGKVIIPGERLVQNTVGVGIYLA